MKNGFKRSNDFVFVGLKKWYSAIKNRNYDLHVYIWDNNGKAALFKNFHFTDDVTFAYNYTHVEQNGNRNLIITFFCLLLFETIVFI